MHAKYPKLLPWMAKKSGVSLDRAEALWEDALRHATQKSDAVESPEYWKFAIERLVGLLAAESRARRAMPFGFGPMVRLPAQLWLHGLTAQHALMRVAADSVCRWQRRTC